MAITVDKANIGTVTHDLTGTTIVITTNQTVAAGATIVAGFAFYASLENITGVVNSGTDLGWTVDNFGEGSGRSVAIARAYAPAGLSSGATITATIAGTGGDYRSGGAMSLLGVKTTSPVDGTPPASVDASGTAVWSTGNLAIAAGSVIVGVCIAPTTSTHSPTSPSLEAWEAIDVPDEYGSVMCYRIESSAGSYAVGGTWGASGNHRNVAVAYLAAEDEPPSGAGDRRMIRTSRGTSW